MKLGIFLLVFPWLIFAKGPSVVVEGRSFNRENLSGLVNIFQDNRIFVRGRGPHYFKGFIDSQHPRSTIVSCGDSRVHTHAFDQTPDNDIFMIRNIGNQLDDTAGVGGVDYGVLKLKPPLLIIVGHDFCGAITAASADKTMEELKAQHTPIYRELESIRAGLKGHTVSQLIPGSPKDQTAAQIRTVRENIALNINVQVAKALERYKDQVRKGELIIIGALYDFGGLEPPKQQGRLVIKNVNGETNPSFIEKFVQAVSPFYEKASPYSDNE